MFPVLQVGSLALPVPGLALLIGVWIGLWLAATRKEAARLKLNPEAVHNLAFLGLVAGLIGARLAYVTRYLSVYASDPPGVFSLARWLRRAGAQAHAAQVSDYLVQNLHVTEVQLDELWTFVYCKEKTLTAWQKLHTEYGDTWLWVAFDPVHKFVVAWVLGDREQRQATTLLQRVKARLTAGVIPYLTSDELAHYAEAILQTFGQWIQPRRRGTRGRFPKARPVLGPDLCYAVVHKTRERGRVVEIAYRIVFGTAEAVWHPVAASPVSRWINTSFVERMNLTFRHLTRRLTRKTLCFSKKRAWLAVHLHLALGYYPFVRPHQSLRRRLAQPQPTRGPAGSPKKWRPRTPAMAAGLTDHVWTMTERLSFRVPAAP